MVLNVYKQVTPLPISYVDTPSYSDFIISPYSTDDNIETAAISLISLFPSNLDFYTAPKLSGEDLLDIFTECALSSYPSELFSSWEDASGEMYCIPLAAITSVLDITLLNYNGDALKEVSAYNNETQCVTLSKTEFSPSPLSAQHIQIVKVNDLPPATSRLVFKEDGLTYNGELVYEVVAILHLGI